MLLLSVPSINPQFVDCIVDTTGNASEMHVDKSIDTTIVLTETCEANNENPSPSTNNLISKTDNNDVSVVREVESSVNNDDDGSPLFEKVNEHQILSSAEDEINFDGPTGHDDDSHSNTENIINQNGLSEYEQHREDKIARNNARMKELGLLSVTTKKTDKLNKRCVKGTKRKSVVREKIHYNTRLKTGTLQTTLMIDDVDDITDNFCYECLEGGSKSTCSC